MLDYHLMHSSAKARIVFSVFCAKQNRTLPAQQLPEFVNAM
jgi:hypothetical protein